MTVRSRVRLAGFSLLLCSLFAHADNTGEGPLNPAKPVGTTTDAIIQRFAAKEKEFKLAREHYTFRQSIKVQAMDGDTVKGEYSETFDVLTDDKGRRSENVVFAPQSSLEQGGVSMGQSDLDDLRDRLPFVLTTDELGDYDILYMGQQQQDELHTYVFDVAPKRIEKGRRYFQGRIWVDDQDFQIVKTNGKNVPQIHNAKHPEKENLSPSFMTWRTQIDGKYWFPTYTLADETLHFSLEDVRLREILHYDDYKRFGSSSTIIYEGKELEKAPPAKSGDPSKPDDPKKPQ